MNSPINARVEKRWEMGKSASPWTGARRCNLHAPGDIVPADARLLKGDEVFVDQSALTGESLPATRKTGEAIFPGSIIRRGEIDALVYATGTNTYFGKTAKHLRKRIL